MVKQQQTRYVGIDYGMARLGLSVSDPTKLIATPLTTLQAQKKIHRTAELLLAYLDTYSKQQSCTIERIVIGMPLLLSGKKGLLADEVLHFVEELKKLTTIQIETWDERLTTVQAERSLKESSLNRKRRAQVVDSVTALILLQNYLDANNSAILRAANTLL